jgi:hypothetical protein
MYQKVVHDVHISFTAVPHGEVRDVFYVFMVPCETHEGRYEVEPPRSRVSTETSIVFVVICWDDQVIPCRRQPGGQDAVWLLVPNSY